MKTELKKADKWLELHSPKVKHLVAGAETYRSEVAVQCAQIDAADSILDYEAIDPATWLR